MCHDRRVFSDYIDIFSMHQIAIKSLVTNQLVKMHLMQFVVCSLQNMLFNQYTMHLIVK